MLTGIVLTKNEEQNIARCLDSLKFCDQILVVDDNSTDKTVEIAKKHKTEVLVHHLDGNFAAQRNWTCSQVKSGWLLFVDADEVISPELASEISGTLLKGLTFTGYFLPREDVLWGKRMRHGDTTASLLRLARRGAGEWVGRVHETWQISGSTSILKNSLIHYPHPSVTEFLRHINHYSTLRAQELKSQGQTASIVEVIFYPILKFLYLGIWKLGFADGIRGFASAMMMSFYSFLVRGKLYLAK